MAISVTGLTVHTQNGGGTWQDWGTGGGSGSTTATFLSGTSSRGRKFTGFKGFGYEISAAGRDIQNTILLVRWLVNGGLGATLAGDGGRIYIEDTSGNEGWWTVAGSDTYDGGWVESVIDTSLALTGNSGTAPSLASIQYVGFYCNAAASSGGDPNVYVDEVLEWPNTGLTLAGNTTNVFDEAADFDETSLYGIITRRSGVIFSKTPLILSPDASDHSSTDETLVFEEPFYEDGTNVDSALGSTGLSSADADTITLTRLNVRCDDNGDITGTNADKELDFASATDIVADTCTFDGFNGTTMALGGSGNSYDDCSFQRCSQITDTGAVVRRGFVRNTAALATEASLLWTSSSDWEDTTFEMGATNSHAIEIETNNLTDSWNGFTFNGYNINTGPTTVGNEVLNNQSTTGTVTINASDITGTISFYNRGGGATTINNNVTVTFDNLKDNTEVRIYNDSTGVELDGIENATAGTVDDRNFPASVAASTVTRYIIHNVQYEYIQVNGFTWPGTNTTLPIQQRFDRNYTA